MELGVTKTLRELNYDCFKSMFYLDAESSKAREIDLVAEAYAGDREHFFQGTLVIECKKSSKPFVILCDDSEKHRIGEYVLRDTLILVRCGKFVVDAQSSPTELKWFNKRSMPVLGCDSRVGYALVKSHSRDDSDTYAEILKLAKAYEDVSQREHERFEKIRTDSNLKDNYEKRCFVVVPLLVVDAPLTEVYIGKKGETIVTETDISILTIRLPWRDLYNPTTTILVARNVIVKNLGRDFLKFLDKVVARRPESDAYLKEKEGRIERGHP